MLKNKEITRFTIPLLLKCNLNCNYCFVKNTAKVLDFDIFKKWVDFFISSEWRRKDFILYWWEPFLLWSKVLDKYLTYIFKKQEEVKSTKDIIVTLNTNLTILNDDLEKLLEKFECIISVSIDGREHSHNLNRWMFQATLLNYKKLESNDKINKKLSINKVVNKDNVNFFFEDIKYLLNNFTWEIFYNLALGVSNWDIISLEKLEEQITLIFDYFNKNDLKERIWNFFKIPLDCCPFWTLSMWLDWKIYNCEFIATNFWNGHPEVLNLLTWNFKKDIFDCRYNILSKKCFEEKCISCGNLCTKFSFPENNFLDKKKEILLEKVKNLRFRHLGFFKNILYSKIQWTLGIKIIINDYNKVYWIYNFIYSLNKFLGIEEFYIEVYSDNKWKISLIEKLIMRLYLKWWKKFNIKFQNNDYLLLVNLDTSYVYDNKNKYIWNISSEIKSFF